MQTQHFTKLSQFLFMALLGFTVVGCQQMTTMRSTDNVRETVAKRGGLKVSIQAASNINKDSRGAAQPVRVKVYQLTDRESFLNANLNALVKEDFLALGDSLIRQTELTVRPGQALNVALDQNIAGRYIGVIALFSQPRGEGWRAVKPLSANGLQVTIDNNQIYLQ